MNTPFVWSGRAGWGLVVCLVGLIGAFSSACNGGTFPRYDYASEPDPRRSEYVIGVADGIQVRVWKNPELSTDAAVRPDGTVTMPLLGDLTAAGKTPSALKAEITARLSQYVRDEGAVVTVAVTGFNSYSFTVSGNVAAPGQFTSPRFVTVLEAIQLAGGPSRFASPESTKIFRRDAQGRTRIIPVNVNLLIQGKHLEANLTLMPGDLLYVP